MVQTLEAIKGGGGSIKVGTRGTISALMTRELDSIRSAPQKTISPRNKNRAVVVSMSCKETDPKRPQPRKPISPRNKNRAVVVSISCKETVPKRPQPRKPMDGASSSGSITKDYPRNNHRVPMLSTDGVSAETTPARPKPERKGHNIVDVVDIKCGNQERTWVSPIAKLKKLGFSKLSESII